MDDLRDMILPFLIVIFLTIQFLPFGVTSDVDTEEPLFDETFQSNQYYLRDAEITAPYKELNMTAGTHGASSNWTVDGPGDYTFAYAWATETMSESVSVDGLWNFTLYIEKPMTTSFDPAVKADVYTYDGTEEELLHEGTSSIQIDQTGIGEYGWSEDVPTPTFVGEGERVVVKFVLDASEAPEVEYLDQEEELDLQNGSASGFPENATEGNPFTLSENATETTTHNETRYLRGVENETTVNDLTGYSLGAEQSNVMQQSESMDPGYDYQLWGIRAWVRHENGTESEITPGHAVAVVNRTGGGSGMQNNTWDCPETSLSPTDSIVVRLYQNRTNEEPPSPPSNLVGNFTTEQLNASQLDTSTWTVHYYTSRGGTGNNFVRWGDPDHNTSIEGFNWSNHNGYQLDARMEIRDIPSAESRILEYKIDSDQAEFELRLSNDGGGTYNTIQDEITSGEFSRTLGQDEISEGAVYLQMNDKGINDEIGHSVELDYFRVRSQNNISLHWNYPAAEYASQLEFPIESSEEIPPPEVTNVSADPSVQTAGEDTNISCDVTSDLGLDEVRVNVTHPDGTYMNVSMSQSSEVNWYLIDAFELSGTYNYSIFARDVDGRGGQSTGHTFEVEPAEVSYVDIDPSENQTISAGDTIDFEAEAYDEFDNLITDENTSFTWESTDERGLFDETTAGGHYVTATYEGVQSDMVTIIVEPSDAEKIEVRPDNTTAQAGNTQSFFAEAYDEYGNSFNITNQTEFTIEDEAKGVWFENVYSSEIAGTWNVTGSYQDLLDRVTLKVEPPSVDHIRVSPESSNITAGESLSYDATAYDEFGNYIADVSAYTEWDIDEGAGGFWDGDEYTSEFLGSWTVNGTYGDSQDDASLEVGPGPVYDIAIEPREWTVDAGASVEYTAISQDRFGNPIEDVTENVSWNIESGANGSWNENIYTSWSTGTWTVTASSHPYSDTALLHVESTDLDPTKFEIVKVSGDEQRWTAGNELEEPLVVEVRDDFDNPVGKGWRVWFNITTTGLDGDGELKGKSPVLTDENGQAHIRMILDSARGRNNVSAEIIGNDGSKRTVFTVLGTLPDMEAQLSTNVDEAASGDIVVFEVQIENVGTERASDLIVFFELHDKLSYDSDTSDVEPVLDEGVYVWHFNDVGVDTHRFDIVCKVSDQVREKHVIQTALELEYTDAQGGGMPDTVSNEVSLEIDATLLEKIYWPLPLIPLILILIGAAWYVYKKVEVEEVFLIHESGILLAHKTQKDESGMDDDLFSSMLTAIQDFIKDSFEGEENYGIKRLEFGDKKILVEKGRYTFIALVYQGRVVRPIEQKMQSVLKKIETDYEEDLKNWYGHVDSVSGIDEYLDSFFKN